MTPRGKNLLEAFSSHGSAGSTPASGAPSTPLSAPVSGSLLSGGARSAVSLRRSQLQWLALAQVVLLVLAFLIGRASVKGTVEARADEGTPRQFEPSESSGAAASPGEPAPSVAPVQPPVGAQVDPTPRTAAEQALLDPRNVYTLKVVDYVFNDSSLRIGRETLRYLSETCGLPACLTRNGTRLYVLVGAAPRSSDLDELGRTVRQLRGPPPISKANEFHDAYVEKIDKVFQRK